jgi:hypothetical protein
MGVIICRLSPYPSITSSDIPQALADSKGHSGFARRFFNIFFFWEAPAGRRAVATRKRPRFPLGEPNPRTRKAGVRGFRRTQQGARRPLDRARRGIEQGQEKVLIEDRTRPAAQAVQPRPSFAPGGAGAGGFPSVAAVGGQPRGRQCGRLTQRHGSTQQLTWV